MTSLISNVPFSKTANLGKDLTLCPSRVQLVSSVAGLPVDTHGSRASEPSDAVTVTGKSMIDGGTARRE